MFEMTALGQSWMYQCLPAALVLAGLVTGCAGMGDQSLDDALAETLEHQTFEFEKNSQSAARSRMGLPHA